MTSDRFATLGRGRRANTYPTLRLIPVLVLAVTASSAPPAEAAEGEITLPYVTGRPGRQVFRGHPGWVDVYPAGDAAGVGARIGANGRFELPDPRGPVCLIAMFDKMETPPIIVPRWPVQPGQYDVAIPVEYACVPAGYPELWDRRYITRGKNFWQTFMAGCTQLYGCSVFDGPKIVWWGNKINVSVHEGGANGKVIVMRENWSGEVNDVSAGHSDHELPRVGWRHGDIELVPGRKYAIRVGGYKPHGGQQFELDAFIRPDKGDGYEPGLAYKHRSPTGGDLCCLIFGNRHGQIVETQIRSEEWEIFIPKRPPVRRWGQTFVAHGVSLAGVCFWASNGSDKPVSCKVRIRQGGPGGKPIGPAKTAVGHDNPVRPIIRYPDLPGPLAGYERYYKLPADYFQAAWLPEEVPLEPGKTYYVELEASEPIMVYADGDYYRQGFAYYDGQKVAKLPKHRTMHSLRWTLAMSIVTYENPGGAPNDYSVPRPGPSADGNLIVNGGAETGDFRFWQVGADPMIDPPTHVPTPPNHSGRHRFGISAGWVTADMYQVQQVPGIVPGRAYQAGMWVCHEDGTDEYAQLLWCDGPFGGEEHLLAQTARQAEPSWTRYEGKPFTPTQTTVAIIVRYRHTKPTNIASIHVDDIYLRPVDQARSRPARP